ncbi:hypothetical protein KXW98_009120 [Aspergillus fumigatus]|nr:hypothetical protein CNMCM8714_007103 [Aspergillus fumigatus]KMK62936.1 RING finger protein [Aspergillus fumigatus Z5]KAF4269621.1 hypothetical protein CNMCM8057_008111 [Aspergillus fumigatus]KAF4271606.1 hypothetical protein CNMCM8812_000413 [Aspergillus fumigatus]KAF4282694.1 hypothetical protein CNMCM8689_008054 [Aspergillus fumigatus]
MDHQSSSPAAVIAVCVGSFVIVVVAMLGIFVQVRRNAARTSASTVVKETKQHSDTEMLQKLESICPTKPYDEWVEHTQTEQDLSDRSSAHFTCSMCLEDVNGTDLMHVLSCRHVYHAHCLEQWFLGRHFSCPLCNRSFFEEVEPGPEPGPDNV